MPRDANGNYTKPNPPVSAGETIQSAYENSNTDDQAAEFTDSLSRSGKGGMLAQLNLTDDGLVFSNENNSGLRRHSSGDIRLEVLGQAAAIFGMHLLNGVRIGKVDKDGSLESLISSIGSTPTTLYLYPEGWPATTNLTIPENISLLMPLGATISPSAGITVTLNCSVSAGIYQIFGGEGSVQSARAARSFPHWYEDSGTTDDTATLIKAINGLANGGTLDLAGKTYNIFVGVSGVTTGDALPLSGVPRIFQKNDITINNGKIVVDSPGVSGTKYRFPTTFSVDGCTNITFDKVTFHSKGENWGDTDASSGLGSEERRNFAQQNGGHACLVVRSENIIFHNCIFRLCGSVGAFYSMSSHNVKLFGCFSNAGSLGYAAYAMDSWAGNKSVSGFAAHYSSLTECSSSKESYTYASKGCVANEDVDVTTEINGGHYADAYPNAASKDIGYAFGCSSSKLIVSGALVENCAAVGYTGTTNNDDHSYLTIDNVIGRGLRKTTHQCERTSVGRMYWAYSNCDFEVVGGGVWPGDGNLSREQTSYAALPNLSNRIHGSFSQCRFNGATYGFINEVKIFGFLKFDKCDIKTNGWLWSSQNIGSGASGDKLRRGIHFTYCGIEDISAEASAYTTVNSIDVYTYIDCRTSTVKLAAARDMESSSIATPGTFVDRYSLPREDVNIQSIAAQTALKPESARIQVIEPTGGSRNILLPRYDKYKYIDFKIKNSSATQNLVIKDYSAATTVATLSPGGTAITWNDGAADHAVT